MKVLEQLMTKTMTNTYVVIFFVGFTFRSLLSFQIYIYIEFTVAYKGTETDVLYGVAIRPRGDGV